MLSLLEKFEKVEIRNEARVSEEDLSFCKYQEESYREAIKAWKEAQMIFRKVMDTYGASRPAYAEKTNNRVYLSEAGDLDFSEGRISAIKGEFIGRLCSYFVNKYNVSIDTYDIKNKYKSDITHQDIIDEIFIQLDGLDFGEKSVRELKEDVSQRLSSKVEIKNKKVTISRVIYIDSFDKKWSGVTSLSYSCKSDVQSLFKGLSHFECGETETNPFFVNLSNLWANGKGEKVFKKHEINLEKVISIKPFQNGKVEVVFASWELAREFAAEYLNHA